MVAKRIQNLYLLISILIYLNIFFGPLVRATDSGLACPDWPLCHGKWIPEYTFQIAMEVGHRYYSGIIGLLVFFGFLYSFFQKEGKNFRKLTTLALILLISQVVLGALTVTKLLDPATVNLHLLNASLLLLSCITIYWFAKKQPNTPIPTRIPQILAKKDLPLFLVVAFVLFQIFLGGRVSSHYSGLACPDFPTCYGEWFPELLGTIRYQMEHRWFGYFLALSIFILSVYGFYQNWNPLTKKLLYLSSGIVVLQIFLGAMNVWFRLPKLLTGFHTLVGVSLLLVLYLAWIEEFFGEPRKMGSSHPE